MLQSEKIKRHAIRDAITALGYLEDNEDCENLLLSQIDEAATLGSDKVTTNFRKSGTQLSPSEKRSLSIRTNAFMTAEALSILTEKGKATPLTSHEVTLRRALFTFQRLKTIAENRTERVTITGSFLHDCAHCAELHGTRVLTVNAPGLQPACCERDVCGLFLMPRLEVPKD